MDETEYKFLLERMASISPGVRAHLGGEHWQLQIDSDEIDSQTLTHECFSLMIDEVFELGIEFYCVREDLCDSLYHIDKTLLLFEVIYPTPLYRSIIEDDGFKRWLVATVRDGAGDPDDTTIMNILNYLSNDHPGAQEIFTDTYDFLHDKILSTPVFDTYILNILETDNTSFDVPIDHDAFVHYIDNLKQNVERLIKAIDLINHLDSDLNQSIQYNRLSIYKTNAIDYNTLAQNVWMYKKSRQTDIPLTQKEQLLLIKFTYEFEGITPFYDVYYRLHAQQLSRNEVVSIIFGCLLKTESKDVFVNDVDTTIQRLIDLIDKTDINLRVFIQKVCLKLVREFYA